MRHGISFLLALLTILATNTSLIQADQLTEAHNNNVCDVSSTLSVHADCIAESPRMHLGLTKDGKAAEAQNPVGYRYPQVPLEVEGYPVAPEGLKLEQVHVYVRHGERTPVGVRMAGPPANIPEHWALCRTARQFRAAVSSYLGDFAPANDANVGVDEILQTRKILERADGTIGEGECLLGELTDLGRQTTFNFGSNLRKLYVDKLGFMPETLPDKNLVYFRTTNMPRTTESLQQIVHGLYPSNRCHPSALPSLLIRNGKDENLIGNTYACKRLEILQVSFAKAAAEAYNHTLEHLDKKVSKYIDGNPIRVDGKPRASGVMDTIRAAAAHGIKIPAEFEDKAIVDVIERAVVNEWFADKTEEVRRLGMGRLLNDVSTKMQAKVDKGDAEPLKLLVHSTHDTALAALCSTLDVFDEKWPAFTASISFELFKQTNAGPRSAFSTLRLPQSILSFLGSSTSSSAPQHYVRMRYQNKDMVLPVCATSGDHLEGHPEFCTLSAFQRRVKELTPTDWDTECSPAGRV